MIGSARAPRVRVTLLMGAVLAVAAAVALGIVAETRPRTSELNYAHVDKARTAALTDHVERITETVFSVTPDTVAATERAARRMLRGDAVGQYGKLYDALLSQARTEKLSMRTEVSSVGVQRLRGDHATVLVFATQRGMRKGLEQPSLGGARIQLRLLDVDDGWKVADIAVL